MRSKNWRGFRTFTTTTGMIGYIGIEIYVKNRIT